MQAGDFAPTELQYSVKQFPRLGHVANLTTSSDGMVLTPISSFTQDDIDQGLIVYVSLTDQVQIHFIYSAMKFILLFRCDGHN